MRSSPSALAWGKVAPCVRYIYTWFQGPGTMCIFNARSVLPTYPMDAPSAVRLISNW